MLSPLKFGARLARAVAAAALIGGAALASASPGQAGQNNYAAFVVDGKTGNVLFSRNADARRYPASLTKMMTLYLLFEDLEQGKVRLHTRLRVSANAAAQPPSKLGLRAGQTIEVEDAIKSLVTRSANDAAMVIAENLGGSEAAFARRMTATARALGMTRTTFRNPHGLPNSEQVTTARDMATLGRALQDRFPTYYRYFSTRTFTWQGRRIGNHNNLLGRVAGVDGIKTGYTRASGYNLVTSVHRDNRYLVGVVMGGNTARSRDAHMVELVSTYLPRASTGGRTAPLLVAAAPAATVAVPTPRPRPDLIDTTAVAAVTNLEDIGIPEDIETAQGDSDEEATAVVAPVAAAVPDGWKIQIGALPSQDAANAVLARAMGAAPRVLASASAYTEPVARGSATLYRARFAGFSNKEAARAACAQLERKSFDCLAISD